jgi:hypothetical protein
MNSYPINTLARIFVQFLDPLSMPPNQPVDPTNVSLTFTLPDQSTLTPTGIVHDDVGMYHLDYVVMEQGLYIYRWQGEGAVIAASPNGFFRGI